MGSFTHYHDAMDSAEDKARSIFGKRASFYTTSAMHTDPQVLQRMVDLAAPQPQWDALDIATGTGHTAFALAPHVRSMIGIDLTQSMLDEAQRLLNEWSFGNVSFQIGDVHHLEFETASFDLVTCRRAAHHFSDIGLALREMRRVLRDGGTLVIDDRSVPEDDFVDRTMNLLDTFHDESHVREYRPSEWKQMLQDAGFRVDAVEPYIKHRPLTSLTTDVSEENVRKIEETLNRLTAQQKEAFHLIEKDGERYLNHWFVMIAACAK
jgi:ubiquinone/menaquinone biosynthesis C-methylase UbiE